jgi:hypothetical protein
LPTTEHCTQLPPTHIDFVPLHPITHDPQWLGSLLVSAHTFPQAVRPAEQVWHDPPMHAAVEMH